MLTILLKTEAGQARQNRSGQPGTPPGPNRHAQAVRSISA
jgi:hypothetical protein